MPTVTARTPVYPSEDPAKVRRALLNLFPDARLEATAGSLAARTESLDHLRNLIWKQKILDAARRALLRSLDPEGSRARFRLNKQAAHQSRVSFSEDASVPLGPIEVEVEGRHLEALFKEMAPMTIRGIPVDEERAEKELAKRRRAKAVTADAVAREREVSLDGGVEGDDEPVEEDEAS